MTETAAVTPAPDFAHELRNQLTAILYALEMARLVAGNDPDLVRALGLVERRADALRLLADDIQTAEVRTAVIAHPRPRAADRQLTASAGGRP